MFKMCCGDCGECWYIGEQRTCTCINKTPKREWQGLTDEDLANCSEDELHWAKYWEKVLKEKNK